MLVLVPQMGEFVVPVGLVATKVSRHEPAVAALSCVTKLEKSSLKKMSGRAVLTCLNIYAAIEQGGTFTKPLSSVHATTQKQF